MIFKAHYGLWYGGLVGIMPFMFNYASFYSGATATQHGTLYTILPFIALLAKPIVCSFADKYHAHKQALIFFIITTMLGYGSLAIYPFFPDLKANHKTLIWALYCVAATVGNTSMCIVNSLGDTLAVNSCKRNNRTYGEYRLWGPVGFGVLGGFWGFVNNLPNLPYLIPGILTLIVIHTINIVLLISWKDQDDFKIINIECNTKSKPNSYGTTDEEIASINAESRIEDNGGGDQSINIDADNRSGEYRIGRLHLFWLLCRSNKSMLGFILLFTLCGILTAIQWQFFFGYLNTLTEEQNKSFSYLTTLILPVQSLGGELVFFFFSGKILTRFGPTLTLTFCLFSFALRYLAYAFIIPVVSIYFILIVELLQGPAFGLMYCVLTHQAQHYSGRVNDIVVQFKLSKIYKNSLNATLQGVIGASFEGLGLGLGAIAGGLAYDVAPQLMWQIAGFSALGAALALLGIQIFHTLSRSTRIMS